MPGLSSTGPPTQHRTPVPAPAGTIQSCHLLPSAQPRVSERDYNKCKRIFTSSLVLTVYLLCCHHTFFFPSIQKVSGLTSIERNSQRNKTWPCWLMKVFLKLKPILILHIMKLHIIKLHQTSVREEIRRVRYSESSNWTEKWTYKCVQEFKTFQSKLGASFSKQCLKTITLSYY